ncbi:hypothetical protein F383_36420 [Gossypium arboreum]|uniref:Uncharacterized protein n=1 Tax=Gossypium arboreum TaxID=29729 RepID=A0A0B0N944_GOSAR|nr:hypothetical protein F383_36420 [Gossypium arboreum]
MVMLHVCVSPGVEIKMKLVCSTRSYTRPCDWSCGTSQYTLNLYGLAHGRGWPLQRANGLETWACGWPCD